VDSRSQHYCPIAFRRNYTHNSLFNFESQVKSDTEASMSEARFCAGWRYQPLISLDPSASTPKILD